MADRKFTMQNDDYFVVVYKVLDYLYRVLKAGEDPDTDLICAAYFKVNSKYWSYIFRNLYDDGYITNVKFSNYIDEDEPTAEFDSSICITPKGIKYLFENSIFALVKDFISFGIDKVSKIKP
jgi:hypothetical protein